MSNCAARLSALAFWFAMLCGGSVVAALVTSVLIPVATNATVALTLVITLALWVGLPAWLVTVAWRQRLT